MERRNFLQQIGALGAAAALPSSALAKSYDPAAKFDVRVKVDGNRITLSGSVSDRKDHDRLIDLFVAMKLFDLKNEIILPTAR